MYVCSTKVGMSALRELKLKNDKLAFFQARVPSRAIGCHPYAYTIYCNVNRVEKPGCL